MKSAVTARLAENLPHVNCQWSKIFVQNVPYKNCDDINTKKRPENFELDYSVIRNNSLTKHLINSTLIFLNFLQKNSNANWD